MKRGVRRFDALLLAPVIVPNMRARCDSLRATLTERLDSPAERKFELSGRRLESRVKLSLTLCQAGLQFPPFL